MHLFSTLAGTPFFWGRGKGGIGLLLDKNELTKDKKGLWHQFKCEYLVTIKKEHSKLKRNHDEVVCPDCEKVITISIMVTKLKPKRLLIEINDMILAFTAAF